MIWRYLSLAFVLFLGSAVSQLRAENSPPLPEGFFYLNAGFATPPEGSSNWNPGFGGGGGFGAYLSNRFSIAFDLQYHYFSFNQQGSNLVYAQGGGDAYDFLFLIKGKLLLSKFGDPVVPYFTFGIGLDGSDQAPDPLNSSVWTRELQKTTLAGCLGIGMNIRLDSRMALFMEGEGGLCLSRPEFGLRRLHGLS